MQGYPSGLLLAGLLFLTASPLVGQANSPRLAEPHPELYHPPDPPVGALGLLLGTFAVIEGIDHPYGMGRDMPGFEIRRVNGKTLPTPRYLPVYRTRLIDGEHYVLHGYELGQWGGEPSLPKGETYGAQVIFGFFRSFVITSIEKENGVRIPQAKPLDPSIALPVPDFEKKIDASPPIGRLGLPLGTFAIIQVRAPHQAVLMESPFEVFSVNGKALPSPQLITIPNAKELEPGKTLTMHGFECGEWASQPPLPESERSRTEPVPQQPFQFFPRFILTSAPVAK